jgi:DNA invertase Pin-like site-specific DNA recombinase
MISHRTVERPAVMPEKMAPRSSTKLQDHHVARTAVVYVRQSTAQQVFHNTESTERQYDLVHRAVHLGWVGDQVEVIDEDLGRSGTTAVGRFGFQRLLAEVSLNHVGIILSTEMSRLARSNKDWHQLIELCAIFRTLLADQDGVYDPTDYNDRLLLGLRGMMSEAETHILQGRMHEALLHKARRGDVYLLPPVGYVKLPDGGFALDPDEQARSVIHLIFDEFDRLGSIRRVLRHLQAQGIKMPIRPHAGPNKGLLEWRRPTRSVVRSVLTHPLYAGIYRYGNRQTDRRRKKPGRPGTGRVFVEQDRYHAWIPEHCPAYITQERYQRNQKIIKENRILHTTKGPTRPGEALLAGILFCGRCQRRMLVHYSGPGQKLRYACQTGKENNDIPRCQRMSGGVLDQLVTDKIMLALQPAALDLSLQAIEDLEKEQARLNKDWRQRLERCRYEADRAKRQYQASEPENRLVARELERQWETALQQLEVLEQDYSRFRQSHPLILSDEQRAFILSLSENLPTVWHAPTTSASDRQRIVRLMVARVVVNIQGSTDQVDVTLHWSGGFESNHELIRPVLGYRHMADHEAMFLRIEELRQQGRTFAEIAAALNQEGFRPAQRADEFNINIVSRIFRKLRQQRPSAREIAKRDELREHEWFALTLAAKLQMPKNTLLEWMRRGWVRVMRQLPGYRGRKICWADAAEIGRLTRLRDTNHSWWDLPLPPELTTPMAPVAEPSTLNS